MEIIEIEHIGKTPFHSVCSAREKTEKLYENHNENKKSVPILSIRSICVLF